MRKKSPELPLPQGKFDAASPRDGARFECGFATAEVMPKDINKKKYWIAGYNAYNPAKGVLDPMTVSAVWIDDSSGRGGVVFVSLDSVGLTNYDVSLARSNLAEFSKRTGCRSVNILSTHNHAGIDTVGMWGPIPFSGRDKGFMKIVHNGIVEVVEKAYADRRTGEIYYGKKEAPKIQRDSRIPHVFNKQLYRLRFVPDDGSSEIWILNFASHTENMLGNNPIVSADFACYLRREVLKKTGARVLYSVGAIGGLIRLEELDKDNVKSTVLGGEILAETAISIADERKLKPIINFIRQEYYSPAENHVLMMLCSAGVLKSKCCASEKSGIGAAVLTEMTYFEIGGLKLLLLPSEIFPELIYGGYLGAELSSSGKGGEINPRPLTEIAGDDELLIFGVSNDFTGYVVPPNDFFVNPDAPYISRGTDATGRGHYEETNSLGPDTAATIAEVFERLTETVNAEKSKKA